VFESITPGDRGPAVEDVQQRLLALGFDLGPTGVDGVFLGATHAAVRRFQAEHRLAEDGMIGDETWSALVDATFTLGDRLLYLKYPHFHGADVRRLQGALNVLGFACGEPDGIFGTYTERAVREFQANAGLPADGIAGSDTVRMLERFRHVWQDKDPASPAALTAAPVRAAEALRHVSLALAWTDRSGHAVAERLANLIRATEPAATVRVGAGSDEVPGGITLTIAGETVPAAAGVPVVTVRADAPLHGRFLAAFGAERGRREAIVMVPASASEVEHEAQACAVRILDGVCAALSDDQAPVLP
jgi:peptidoglycan hydrolase-like protein with peptidoglycan-binding domain